ncbi:PKD domain-containing protein [Flavisolibacter nicotianae]|uniref:PKD domain-containing protein n=1 Tax=Flavisolibacter nicotianae TaxID=2364882 RepID=UPI000EB2568C|nr:PKD domain-containing protein [Flavisolibacter nicotianae]
MNALVPNHRRSLIVLLFLLCLNATASAQIRAAFSATPVSGCSPLAIYFSDSSSGSPTQWRWDLGNGVTSYLRNPSATYFNPGTYTVKLVVSNAQGKDSVVKSRYITVYDNPLADFRFNKSTGCFPLAVSFSDQSTPGSGSLVSWQWDFGDGTIANQQNPVHTYTAAGTYSVTLRVTNSFGCSKSFTKEQAISIANGVKAGFSNTNPGSCPAPATVQFTNSTTGPGPLQFLWNFGDGATSSESNPAHTYSTNGTYSVSLVATSPQGCVDTAVKPDLFKIGAAKAAFTNGGLCAGKPAQFTSTSPAVPVTAQWNFGDGTTSTVLNPVKTYATAGTFTVQLIANFGSCADTLKKTVTVTAAPSADFTVQQQAYCSVPATVQFSTPASNTPYQYTWDFGDSTNATGSNPTHTYSKEGNYTIRLVVTNDGGCSDTIVKTNFIQVQKPKVTISGLPKTGCTPLTITPAVSVSGNQTLATYRWSFGDGTTSASPTPSHTYSVAGNYTVSLVFTTATGCTDSIVLPRAVRTGEKPHADFGRTPVTVCPYEKVFFTDKSTGRVDQWFWEFGDGGTSTEQNPVHQYGDTGWHNVRLIVFNNTCPDTLTLANAVYVNPPFAHFAVQNDCANKFTKKFVDQSVGPKTWYWEFGDGSTSTLPSPEHVYAGTGRYQVKLIVTNGSCTHFTTQTVMVIDEKADFQTSDSVLCRNTAARFSSAGINSNNIKNWNWNFGDGTTSTDVNGTSHAYAKAGTFTVTLTVTDLLGCSSTRTRQVTVFGPTASFKPQVAATCLKDNIVTFTESSVSDGQHPIVQRIWNFGDGQFDSTASAPYQHSYGKAGSYTVSLFVQDNFGCRDSSRQNAAVVIAQPVAAFGVSDTVTCTDKALQFTNASTGISPIYQWSFGDGRQSTLANPLHAYPATGVYTVSLLVTDQYGCKDSMAKNNLVTVSLPKAVFSVSDSVGTCPPLLVHFTNESKAYKSIRWDFGDGNTSQLDTPSHFYSFPGTYYATLVATGPGGCTDTMRKKIVVKGPSGSFTYAPLSGCKPLTVTFNATTKNDASFIWDFSDGATEAGNKQTSSHTYTDAGDFVPKIILTDAAGCSVPIIGTDTIRVKSVTTSFDLGEARFCDGGTVTFRNHTVSNDLITGYRWNFGDGSTSTAANPEHRYTQPGLYSVQLQAITQSGCSDQHVLTDTVKIYASPIVKIGGDTASCAPVAMSFNSQVVRGNPAQLHWQWDFANGNTSAQQNPGPQRYAADGRYMVSAVVTDQQGCRDTATRAVKLYPAPATDAGADRWICRGSFQQLKVTGAATYRWQAAPSLSCTDCDSPLAAPTDSTRYIVTGSNGFGCSTSDSVVVRVHQPFKLSIGKGDTICAGETVHLAALGADRYTWTPSLDIKNPTAGITTATPAASTQYTVVAKDAYNCFTETGSVFVKVWPVPTVTVQDVQTLQVGNSLQLNPVYSADVKSYYWSNAQTLSCATCPSPVAKPKAETKYSIEVKNEGGCKAQAAVTVHVICNNGNLFIPNTFSPNTDGTNDRFYPRGTGISSIKSLKVFNRWGELVFAKVNFNANDATAGWDGTFKGQALAPDVYIYTCEVVCMNNEVLTFKGDVTLLR